MNRGSNCVSALWRESIIYTKILVEHLPIGMLISMKPAHFAAIHRSAHYNNNNDYTPLFLEELFLKATRSIQVLSLLLAAVSLSLSPSLQAIQP